MNTLDIRYGHSNKPYLNKVFDSEIFSDLKHFFITYYSILAYKKLFIIGHNAADWSRLGFWNFALHLRFLKPFIKN